MDKRNMEQYLDLTAYEAITNITRKERKASKFTFRPMVYICSPYAGDTKTNTLNARRYSRFAYDMGAITIAPHLLFPQFIDDTDPDERNTAMFMNAVILGKCRELWVFGEIISHGMSREIDRAKKRNMKVRYFTDECEELKQEALR